MRRMLLRNFCIVGPAGLLATSASFAGVWHVKASAPAGGDGSSWASAMNDLQAAIGAAQPGDEIWVAQGVYKPHPTDRNISFNLKNGVALYGGFLGLEDSLLQRGPANTSTLSGEINTSSTSDNTNHVVQAFNVDATAVLDGFLITAGQAPSSPWNLTGYGGGVLVDASITSGPTIRGCVFSNNSAPVSGGALYIVGGNMRLERCFFFGNRVTASSGGGGAIGVGVVAGGNLTIVNCIFSQNFTLSSSGGAIYAYGGDILNVYSSTFYNNSAPAGGVLGGSPAVANFRNCVFNGPGGAAAYFGAPVDVRASIVPGGMTGEGNISVAATFVNAAAANYRLAPSSSGINAGNNTLLPPGGLAKDYDLNPRILEAVIEMGAYEFVALTCAGDLNKDGVVDDADFVEFARAYNNLLDIGGDLNGDTVTDDADFVIFAAAYDTLLCA
ncbi:MAG: hypothetical protein J0L78_02020 [Planctomycetes bacterium]|nr:hypothetical protein [Planctomycetota bacterium]